MKSNEKRIGDFIQLVDERNTDLKITTLLGLSISKEFIPSVANTVGTNMARYKVIRKNQFACSLMQVRRDKKMPVALLKDFDEAIISQAYPVFKVVDEGQLSPEYLMMWMSRAEFDRHACFLAVGGVRGSLEWEDFLDMPIPVPSLQKQWEIVKEYNTIVKRIKLNEQLNQKLEETAQAVYKHWFVDFEFPDENGQPYKSSGGEMVWNEELGKDVPVGWVSKTLDELVNTQYGYTASADYNIEGPKFLRITDIANEFIDWDTVPNCEIHEKNLEKYTLHEGDIIVARTGATVGFAQQINKKAPLAVFASYLVRLTTKDSLLIRYIGYSVVSDIYRKYIHDVAGGSAQPQANAVLMTEYKLVLPTKKLLMNFNTLTQGVVDSKELIQLENSRLFKFKSLILSKMTKTETEQE